MVAANFGDYQCRGERTVRSKGLLSRVNAFQTARDELPDFLPRESDSCWPALLDLGLIFKPIQRKRDV